MRPRLFTLICITLLLPASANAQNLDALTRAYPDSLCSSCAEWNAPQTPLRIHHTTYYVGTRGLSAMLIASSEGHILIDGGLPDSAPLILENIRSLGYDPADIKLILNSHAHFDHAGGIAAIQHVSGARVAASPKSAPVLKRGQTGPDDPQYGIHLAFPAVASVERFTPGDTLWVGQLEVVSHATAGHTPGGTSWSWRSCDGNDCMNIVYADSQTPVSADGFRFTDSETYPSALADFEHGLGVLERMPCDILISTHPGASSFWERVESENLVNPQACQQYATAARRQVDRRIEREAEDLQNQE